MHRLQVEKELLLAETPTLSPGAAKHLRIVRPADGEQFELFDGKGNWRVYTWHGGLFATSQIQRERPPARTLTLFACVTKGSRWDWTIEKATELGVNRIVPVISERTIVRLTPGERMLKKSRWLRVAEDAVRQSDSRWIPNVLEPVDFKDSLSLVQESTCFIGALTNPPSMPLVTAISLRRRLEQEQKKPSSDYSVFIGPEGDLTPEELSALMKIATPTNFGSSVLRAETAAIYALSVLSAMLQLQDSPSKISG